MPEFTYHLVCRPSGYREYHIEDGRGYKYATCDSLAQTRFLIHVLNNVSGELLIKAHEAGAAAGNRSAA